MDKELEEQERRKLAAAKKRTLTHCHGCGGTHSVESPHPLGLPLVVLQCLSCGREKVLVKAGDYYKKPGGGRKRGIQ